MTCREKLAIEHPGQINETYGGGCIGCPHTYQYLPKPDYCNDFFSVDQCCKCWDREIPEEEKPSKTIYAHIGPFDDAISTVAEASKNIGVDLDDMTNAFNSTWPKDNPHISDGVKKAMEEHTANILDSGNRREFETGAVRDIQEGKGRCDLLPLSTVSDFLCYLGGENKDNPFHTYSWVFLYIADFTLTNNVESLYEAICKAKLFDDPFTMLLEVSKHFEEGCKKYGENNWQKGIPVRCYIDSAVRHYLKFLRGDKDEPHDRAFCWNILCAIWTCNHKPELNDYAKSEEKQ